MSTNVSFLESAERLPATSGTVSGSGSIKVSGSHVYQNPGTYTIQTTLLDKGGSRASASSTVTVSPSSLAASPVAANLVEGSTSSAPLATFTHSDGNSSPINYSVSLNWDEGSKPSADTIPCGNGIVTVSGMRGHGCHRQQSVESAADSSSRPPPGPSETRSPRRPSASSCRSSTTGTEQHAVACRQQGSYAAT
jgi:PKD repeat protein